MAYISLSFHDNSGKGSLSPAGFESSGTTQPGPPNCRLIGPKCHPIDQDPKQRYLGWSRGSFDGQGTPCSN